MNACGGRRGRGRVPGWRWGMGGLTLLVWVMVGGAGMCAAVEEPPVPSAQPAATGTGARMSAGVMSGPRMVVGERLHDFGKVLAGEVQRHTFVFTNAGNAPLEIASVHSSCGCTTAGDWSRKVEPGQGGAIPIELHTTSLKGAVSKPITVRCNDTNQPVVVLEVRATVWRPIEVQPASASLRVILGSTTNPPTVVRVVNQESTPLTLSAPESDRPEIAAALRTVEAGKVYEVVLTAVPPLGSGNVMAKITAKTSSPSLPVLTIPAWIVVQPAVTVIPTRLVLPRGPFTKPLVRDVSVRRLAGDALVLTEPTLNVEGIQAQMIELEPGTFYTMRLTFPPGFELPAGRKAVLRVKSNHPRYPELQVPIETAGVPPGVPAGVPRVGVTNR